ncbi:MAG: FtsW/RodA/SpoVE family cell cycle protein [Ilumatobacteraceae bacterium]
MAQRSPIAAARRNTELSLILMGAVITAAAYVLASLGKNAQIPQVIVPFLVAILLLLLVAHVANRLLAAGADATLLPLAALLNGLGYVIIARLSDHLAGLQTTWTFISILAYVGVLLFVQRAGDLARYKWTFLFLGAGLLMLPLVPGIGYSSGGARIWVNVGHVNFQPGELAKILLALFFAGYLAERRELIAAGTWRVGPLHLPEPRHLLPILLAWAFSVLVMVAEKDLGSSLLFFTLFVVMIWVATERAAFLAIGLVLFAGAAFLAWKMFSHVQTRVTIWINPWPLYEGKGYQIIQAAFALADGGVSGTGLGRGRPTKIPEVKNDFIFAAIGEELGLLGATAILIAFILLIGAGLRTATRSQRPFEKILATGLTAIVGVQAFIIIGGVIRVVPLTGITLPFVSYGGSSLLANYILLGLLVRISDAGARQLGEVPDALTIGERMEARTARRRERDAAKAAAGAMP